MVTARANSISLCVCTEPPYFTVRPEDVHVVKKGFVLLACSAVSSTGEPTHVQWTQAHVNMSRTGPRHLVLQDNSLLLSNVRVQEAGEYSCVASNSYGQSVVSATVTVSSESPHVHVHACHMSAHMQSHVCTHACHMFAHMHVCTHACHTSAHMQDSRWTSSCSVKKAPMLY